MSSGGRGGERTGIEAAARRRRLALAAMAAGVAILLALMALHRIPPGAIALIDSPVRAPRAVGPGWTLTVPLLESVEVLDPYTRIATLRLTTVEGVAFDCDLELAVRLTRVGADSLIAGAPGGAGSARENLDAAVDSLAATAVTGSGLQALLGGESEAAGRAVAEAMAAHGSLAAPPRVTVRETAALAAIRSARMRENLRQMVQDTGAKILLVGLDGADWQIAEPLMAAGRLPNLARLRRAGAWGNIKSLTPILSPLLWTSVATGVTAERHGIVDFLAPDPRTGARLPVNSSYRKARAVWNYFTEMGRSTDVVAWWATWPAEPIHGRLISDRVSYSLFDLALPAATAGLTHPPELIGTLRARLVPDDAVTHQEIARFADVTRDELAAARGRAATGRTASYRDPLAHLVKILASTRSYHGMAVDLIRSGPADLTMVYYQGIDEVCHRFMHFAPPGLPGIDAEATRKLGRVVERFYEHQDRLLGEIVAAAGPAATVIVISDHGFVSGPDRPAGKTADIEGQPGRWHRPYGILVMSGPRIRPGKLDTTSLLDIAPTIMQMAGLPVPEDMSGRVLGEALAPDFLERFPERRLASDRMPPFIAASPPLPEAAAGVDAEMLENLRSLGYIGSTGTGPVTASASAAIAPPTGAAEAIPDTVTSHTNLAGVHLAAGRLEEAEAEILAALRTSPRYPPAQRQLFDLRMRQGRHAEALAVAEQILAAPEVEGDVFLTRVAKAYHEAGRDEEGIRDLTRMVESGRWLMGAPLARLHLERGDQVAAGEAARRVLAHDPTSESAMAVLVQVARSAGDLAALEPSLERALQIKGRSVMHLNWLALARESRGDAAGAEKLLLAALEVDPDHGGTIANLGAVHLRAGRAPVAEPLLRRALRIQPANDEARVNLGTALAMQRRLDEAIDQFDDLVEGGSEDPAIFNALGRAYGEKGDLRSAADWFRRSLQVNPDQPAIREIVVKLQARAGRPESP